MKSLIFMSEASYYIFSVCFIMYNELTLFLKHALGHLNILADIGRIALEL